MPEHTQRSLAWRIHHLVFDGHSIRDTALLARLKEGGQAVARFLFEHDKDRQRLAELPFVLQTAERMLRRARCSRNAAAAYAAAASPRAPRDPLEALGHTDDPALSYGVLAALHDAELMGQLEADGLPLPTILSQIGRRKAVHECGRIVGRTWDDDPESLNQILAAFAVGEDNGHDLAEVLQARRRLEGVERQIGAPVTADVNAQSASRAPVATANAKPRRKKVASRKRSKRAVPTEKMMKAYRAVVESEFTLRAVAVKLRVSHTTVRKWVQHAREFLMEQSRRSIRAKRGLQVDPPDHRETEPGETELETLETYGNR